jgi:hypothetical protein
VFKIFFFWKLPLPRRAATVMKNKLPLPRRYRHRGSTAMDISASDGKV